MLLAPRAPGESFSAAARRLLDDLARQAGVAAYAVRLTTELQHLTTDLQRSREQLVTLREEERRRLCRDLHDGLGPTLAGFTLTVGAVRNLLNRDPPAADKLLLVLGSEIEAAVADIKRLVYNLRPPALDKLGLLGAILPALRSTPLTGREIDCRCGSRRHFSCRPCRRRLKWRPTGSRRRR